MIQLLLLHCTGLPLHIPQVTTHSTDGWISGLQTFWKYVYSEVVVWKLISIKVFNFKGWLQVHFNYLISFLGSLNTNWNLKKKILVINKIWIKNIFYFLWVIRQRRFLSLILFLPKWMPNGNGSTIDVNISNINAKYSGISQHYYCKCLIYLPFRYISHC